MAFFYPQYVSTCQRICDARGGTLSFVGKTVCGYDIPLLSFGKTPHAPRVFVVGSVHAREHITTDLLLALLKYPLPSNVVFDFVPMLNIDGVLLATRGLGALPLSKKQTDFLLATNGNQHDFSLWKANAHAVDLNVNFDAGWGTGKQNQFSPHAEHYVGPHPHSEPETQAVVSLLNQRDYQMVVCYHAKGEEVYWGFGENLRFLEQAACFSRSIGYILKPTPHSAGGIKDYFTKTTGRLGLTVEVGEDRFSHPYPKSELNNLVKKHQRSFFTLGEIATSLWTTK